MLQTDPNFSQIFDNTPVPCGHRVNEWLDRGQRSHVVGGDYIRERGN